MYNVSVFISHSWNYSEHYERLAGWIFDTEWNENGIPIRFHDTSVPKENPIHFARNDNELRNAIYSRIAMSNVVVIPTGMYVNYSKWINKEIDGARIYGKPILAVNPWAQERKSSIVATASSLQVGWNKQSVIDGIWSLR
jgi:hypothetical protein